MLQARAVLWSPTGPRPISNTGFARPRSCRIPGRLATRRAQGLAKDTIGGWIDLASFVSNSTETHTPYDDLAALIGKEVYLDMAGWHLYLKDLKVAGSITLAQALAAQLGAGENNLENLLALVPIKLGGGKATVTLGDVMPLACVERLGAIAEGYLAKK